MAGSPVKEGDVIYVSTGRDRYLTYKGDPNRARVVKANRSTIRSGRRFNYHIAAYDSDGREREITDRKGEYLTENEFSIWQTRREADKHRKDEVQHQKELTDARVYINLVQEFWPDASPEDIGARAAGLYERYQIYTQTDYRLSALATQKHIDLIDEIVRSLRS